MAEVALRPATLDDASFVADVATAVTPERPADPVEMRYGWQNAPRSWVEERWIATIDGRPAGYATHAHPRWDLVDKRFGTVSGDLLPADRSAHSLDVVLAKMEDRSRLDGAATLGRARTRTTRSRSVSSPAGAIARTVAGGAGCSTSSPSVPGSSR